MKQTIIKLYEYDELSKEAKEKAFNEHEMFLRENPEKYEMEDKNGNIIEKYDNMDEWTLNDIKEYVEDSIRINSYLFFSGGDLAYTVLYTGKHPEADKHILKIGEEEYILNRGE